MEKDEKFKGIDRELVKQATLIEMELLHCDDPKEYMEKDSKLAIYVWEEIKRLQKEASDAYDEEEIWDDDEEELPELEIDYDEFKSFGISQAILTKDGKYIYMISGRFSEAFGRIYVPEVAGWIKVQKDGQWGWLDGNLEFTQNLQEAHEYNLCETDFCYDLHKLSREEMNKFSEMDDRLMECEGEEHESLLAECKERAAHCAVCNEISIIQIGDLWGAKDSLDFMVVPPEYLELAQDKYGWNLFGRKESGWGVIKGQGTMYFDQKFVFDEVPQLAPDNKRFVVKKDGKFGLYDPYSKAYTLEPIYDQLIMAPCDYDYVVARIGKKYAYVDSEHYVPAEYDRIETGRGVSFVLFKKDGVWGFMDKDMKWTPDIDEANLASVDIRYEVL